MKQHERFEQYLERNPEQAVTMHFSVSMNLSPEIKRKEQAPPRRFNIAKLQLDSFILVSKLYEALNTSNPDNKSEDR